MDLREIISRALADSDFRCSLLSDPKAVIERCLGVSLPPEAPFSNGVSFHRRRGEVGLAFALPALRVWITMSV